MDRSKQDTANLNQKVSTGKLARSAITGLTAAKIGASLAAQKSQKLLSGKKITQLQLRKNEQKIGKILFSALSQLRGTALKVSQMLSTEVDLLPEGVRIELAKSCYKVTPLNRALVNKVFVRELKASPSDVFATFEAKAFAAASLGQVHKAEIESDNANSARTVAVKIQYPGIATSINSDMTMIRSLLTTLAGKSDLIPNREVIDTALDEIEERLQEEVDYVLEAKNTRWFQQNMAIKNIVIPDIFAQYSSEKVLTTGYLEGLHLEEWLASSPNQTERDHYGQLIFDSFLYSAFKLSCLHADPHPGNYLFMPNRKLGILDFGCIKTFDERFAAEKATLLNTFLDSDIKLRPEKILQVYQDQGVLKRDLSLEEFSTQLLPLLEPMYQWVSSPFNTERYDFSEYASCPKMSFDDAKLTNKYLYRVPKDQIYFDRSMFGVFSMLKRIGAVVNTANSWIGAEHIA